MLVVGPGDDLELPMAMTPPPLDQRPAIRGIRSDHLQAGATRLAHLTQVHGAVVILDVRCQHYGPDDQALGIDQ